VTGLLDSGELVDLAVVIGGVLLLAALVAAAVSVLRGLG
jgi:hypothetical protein